MKNHISIKCRDFKKNNNIFQNKINKILIYEKNIILACLIILIIIVNLSIKRIYLNNNNNFYGTISNNDNNFKYDEFENDMVTNKMKQYSGWMLNIKEVYFINGIIRKHKPKNCLEIGSANGGSSILILNAIKDIKNSFLISIDLNKKVFFNLEKEVGYRVNEYFPELTKNWKLFTGDQPHKFLVKLNIKFDFIFLDSAHLTPGEILNFIEILPFLNENAIIVIHDILWHFKQPFKIYPSNINLLPAIYGDKILLKKENEFIDNTGAVFLYPNQKSHYLDYFILLLGFWEYMPTDKQISDLKIFIKVHYKNKLFSNIFDQAVNKNRKAIEKYSKTLLNINEYNKRLSHIIINSTNN